MLNKTRFVIFTLLALTMAACSGTEDAADVVDQVQQNVQQAPLDQQAQQGQQDGQAPQHGQQDGQAPQQGQQDGQAPQQGQQDGQGPQQGQQGGQGPQQGQQGGQGPQQGQQGQQSDGNGQLAQSGQAPNSSGQLADNQNAGASTNAVIASANLAGQFSSNVTITFTDTLMIVESDGLPSHGVEATSARNVATEQNFRFEIPLNPQLADSTTETPMGPIGIALSGAVFYNGYTSDGLYAVELEILDQCGGHADGRGIYHYHEESLCIEGNLIGYAFDGFEVRKSVENDGSAVTGLDECNGHEHDGEYHYHATNDPSKPLIGCYAGVVETSNINRGGGGGNLGGGGAGAPPAGGGDGGGGRRRGGSGGG